MKMSKLLQKTLIGQILTFGVLALVVSLFSAWSLYRYLTEEYTSKGTAIANSIASSSVELLLNRDASTIQATIDQFLNAQDGVAYVFVVDDHNEIISHTFVPGIPAEVLTLKQNQRNNNTTVSRDLHLRGMGAFIDITAPILAGVGGYVHVGMDKGIISAKIWAAIAQLIALIGIIFLLSTIGAYLWVNQLSRPLNQLTAAAAAVAAGNHAPMVEVRSNDELGMLATTFNQMTRELGAAQQRLENRNQTLERTVEERTRVLAELGQAISERDQLIATIREVSSPVVPVLDGILVMPLIGVIDSQRATTITVALLAAIEQHRAKIAIIDVTGVPLIDTQVAQALLQAAGAARLLGTSTVLVGLRPELAQTIVGLNLNLTGLVTRADLQSGVTYAMQVVRQRHVNSRP
jgi:anti-anti-sigma regulatory factor/HAMP domain-containing protein